MDEAKIYNVCLQRVKFQVGNAKLKSHGGSSGKAKTILESYNTGDVEEIIDILEIYDIDVRDRNGLHEKLDDLAYTVSLLVGDEVSFDYDEKGNLGLYLNLNTRSGEEYHAADASLAVPARQPSEQPHPADLAGFDAGVSAFFQEADKVVIGDPVAELRIARTDFPGSMGI